MTDQKILEAIAAVVRPTFRTDADPLPHPDETALVYRLAAYVEAVFKTQAGALEKAYEKGWRTCASIGKREMDSQCDEFATDFAANALVKLRERALAVQVPDAEVAQ